MSSALLSRLLHIRGEKCTPSHGAEALLHTLNSLVFFFLAHAILRCSAAVTNTEPAKYIASWTELRRYTIIILEREEIGETTTYSTLCFLYSRTALHMYIYIYALLCITCFLFFGCFFYTLFFFFFSFANNALPTKRIWKCGPMALAVSALYSCTYFLILFLYHFLLLFPFLLLFKRLVLFHLFTMIIFFVIVFTKTIFNLLIQPKA